MGPRLRWNTHSCEFGDFMDPFSVSLCRLNKSSVLVPRRHFVLFG
jgi:hypothetical protein